MIYELESSDYYQVAALCNKYFLRSETVSYFRVDLLIRLCLVRCSCFKLTRIFL